MAAVRKIQTSAVCCERMNYVTEKMILPGSSNSIVRYASAFPPVKYSYHQLPLAAVRMVGDKAHNSA